jgi:hypothetical protein
MLVHDKLSLALSVPDITVNSQYNSPEKQGQVYPPPAGEWTSCSVPIQQQEDLLTITHLETNKGIYSTYDMLPRCQYTYPGPEKKTVVVMEPGEENNASNSNAAPNHTLAIPDGSALSGSSGSAQDHGWFNGIMGCLRPVWSILGKANHDLKHLKNQSKSNNY